MVPHFNLASNSLICYQYELVKIPVLPVLKAMSLALNVGTFWWTSDWRCAHYRYQPLWSLPRRWCYQLVCSPILGSNDIWLLGLTPGLTFSNRAKPIILTGKLTWRQSQWLSHSSSSHVSLGRITTGVKGNPLSTNTSGTLLAPRLALKQISKTGGSLCPLAIL